MQQREFLYDGVSFKEVLYLNISQSKFNHVLYFYLKIQ